MPGGMGGMMGMLGGGGRGGGGGGGRGQSGGQSRGQGAETEAAAIYDVDRWKRAEQETDGTALEQVRAEWEKEEGGKKRRFSPFRRREKRAGAAPEQEAEDERFQWPNPPKKQPPAPQSAQPRQAGELGENPAPAESPAAPPCPPPVGKTLLGLSTPSSIDGFFSANPVNSALLAVDSLGLGGLALNQVASPVTREETDRPVEVERGGFAYMEELRRRQNSRKYDVHIL